MKSTRIWGRFVAVILVLFVIWFVTCILLSVCSIISNAIFFSKCGTGAIDREIFFENKEDFEVIAEATKKFFDDEYAKNNDLMGILFDKGSADYCFRSDESITKTIQWNEDVLNSFDTMYDIVTSGEPLGGFGGVFVTQDSVRFFCSDGRVPSIVYSESASKPDSITFWTGDKEAYSQRLTLHWFACAPLKNE